MFYGSLNMSNPNDRYQMLFLIPSMHGGGAERVFTSVMRHLDRSVFSITLAIIDMSDSAFLKDVPGDIDVIDLQSSRVLHALPKIIKLIWKMKPDAVFSTLGHLNVALAMIRPFLPNGIRYIARESNTVTCEVAGYSHTELWHWAYKKFYKRFDRVICQSHYMKNDLVDNFSFPEEKAVVINNPVDQKRIFNLALKGDEIPEHKGKVSMVAAGRLAPQKGFDILIKAVARCNNPDIHISILGDGALKEDLQKLANTEGVSEQVSFLGFTDNPYQYFSEADVFVLSSRYEGLPNVVLEALALGTPVIALPSPGGTREIVESVEGCILARDVSVDALAEAMQEWLAGDRKKIPLSVVGKYSVSRIMSQYETLLIDLLKS
jgi:glycosyltransferase involved in cell wall biosynthesis